MGKLDGPFAIPVNVDYSIEFLQSGAQSHTFEDYWLSQGYPGTCLVQYNLYGDAAPFSSVGGSFVHVEPVATADQTIGLHQLWLVGTYSYYIYDVTTPTVQATIFTVDIIVQRNADIEDWNYKLMASLVWALLVLVITTVYLFLDKFRRIQ